MSAPKRSKKVPLIRTCAVNDYDYLLQRLQVFSPRELRALAIYIYQKRLAFWSGRFLQWKLDRLILRAHAATILPAETNLR